MTQKDVSKPSRPPKQTYQTGLAGEQTAADWLREHRGMVCLESRYRTPAGEIDLIMTEGKTLVFVEVKTRLKASPGEGMLSVDAKKQRRVSRAAMLYLMRKGWTNRPVRFDVVEVRRDAVLHIPNAFQPGGMFFR